MALFRRTKGRSGLQLPSGSLLQPPAPVPPVRSKPTYVDIFTSYVNTEGQNVANAYAAYVATLPAGGLPPGQAMNAAQLAALNAYNQAVAAQAGTTQVAA